ncbi:hypothetical protein BST92_01895 [Nonlabens arenilitoris]|uniref:DUF1800 domain-containing protein n=1 Tax=Nonlabens arenilitoris TaxID=1217969 RepID=A0A2S7U8W8_9FLAO|nr:DUF1800 domain-containing protein [Nonlabens arenilitoris]PQJ30753.1 hypothetical protein BST92_01895 [Nonlabens arenilitoris]
MEISDLKHLYWRLGFGVSPAQLEEYQQLSREKVVDLAFAKAQSLQSLSIDLSPFEVLREKGARKKMTTDTFRSLRQKGRQMTRDLNHMWLQQLSLPEAGLREKMTLFWTNVFVCRDNMVWNTLWYHNMLREHALGNLRDFLKAMSRQPAMLNYLNSNKNVKNSPNENFVRELMELFTLGIGNYTETDVQEGARAFTGWSSNRQAQFIIRDRQHDGGVKTFLGKTGNWNGDDIIDIILEQKACARFICKKIYRYFVNPQVDEVRLQEITDLFYANYDIEKLMRYIFSSDWFYEAQHKGVKIKSPVELLAGIQKVVPTAFNKEKQLFYLQKMMGQVLFYPPNVAGWKGDRSWIDANTLVLRMNLASAMLNNMQIEFQEQAAFEDSFEDFYKVKKKRKTHLKVTVDWELFEKNYRNQTVQELKDILLATTLDVDTARFIDDLPATDKRIRCVQLMSLPEYQMC